MSRWDKIIELINIMECDDTLSTIDKKDIKCLCYAPNMRHDAWIFRYMGVLVCLLDLGNGHWVFHTVADCIDYLFARFWR